MGRGLLRRWPIGVLALATALTACGGEDTGGAIDVPGTAPLREGVTTTAAAGGAGTTAPSTGGPGPTYEGTRLTATLAGGNEIPGPGDADGAGTAAVTLSDKGQVCANLTVTGIDPATAAHIHTGKAGLAGPILVTLPTPANGTAEGCTMSAPQHVMRILADPAGFYVNVHTGPFPNGAIRGQLARA